MGECYGGNCSRIITVHSCRYVYCKLFCVATKWSKSGMTYRTIHNTTHFTIKIIEELMVLNRTK